MNMGKDGNQRADPCDAEAKLDLGFKRLGLENWSEADIPRIFSITADQWVSVVIKPQLSDQVPREIVRLFEVARGSILYGWYFYPLCTLASEQMFRVLEAAIRKRCIVAGLPVKRTVKRNRKLVEEDLNLSQLISALVAAKIISAQDRAQWENVRKLRNHASHPKDQTIVPPGYAAAEVARTAGDINSLFAASNSEEIIYPIGDE